MSRQPGGITSTGTIVTGGGHVVGGNLSINSPEAVVDAMEARGLLQTAETAGLQRRVVVMLAQRLRPTEQLDFEQAITELKRAVEIAIEVIESGARGTSEDAFVNAVLAEAAEKTKNNDLDGAAQAVDDAFADLERRKADRRKAERREGMTILEAAIRQHTLCRDAAAVAERIERLVAVEHATERPAWHPGFRARYDRYEEDGWSKGVHFSLEVAVACVRRMVVAACDADERDASALLLGIALWALGNRERGTARLEAAVDVFRAMLQERTREQAPLQWATIQNNLGNALMALAERESGTERLHEAIAALRAALKEQTREEQPLQWAMTQTNLGNALLHLGERENATAPLQEAVIAYREALKVRTPSSCRRNGQPPRPI